MEDRLIRIAIATDVVGLTGGKELAVSRLAQALHELGHDIKVFFSNGTSPESDIPYEAMSELGEAASNSLTKCGRTILRFAPDALVMSIDKPQALRYLSQCFPVILHSHVLANLCPDGSKYWARLGKVCTVNAGLKCLPLRPLLKCSGFPQNVDTTRLRSYLDLLDILRTGKIGVFVPSADLYRRCVHNGVPAGSIAVMPNLGMRLTPDQLAETSELVTPAYFDKVLFLGRLAYPKGAHLLPELAKRLASSQLEVFGEGYLSSKLSYQLGDRLHPFVDQSQVSGLLLQTRAVAFLSMWPEPGGIVGIDSQLFGVPTGAFKVGAAIDWPRATLFAPGDMASMASWLDAQSPVNTCRDVEQIAKNQAIYWSLVGKHAEQAISDLVSTGNFANSTTTGAKSLLEVALESAALNS